MRLAEILWLGLTAGWLAGCASVPSSSEAAARSDAARGLKLAEDLTRNAGISETGESLLIGTNLVRKARDLAEAYEAVRPAWFHNTLVNAGMRERGLCYHWAEDLERHLASLQLQWFVIHRCVARRGTPREHNAVVLTAHGQPFRKGLVLDAWRKSGQLVWFRVEDDRYPWKPDCGHTECNESAAQGNQKNAPKALP